MARVFIFAQQVKALIAAGNKEIEVPEGAVVSAAAADVIKEHQLRIKTTPPAVAAPTGVIQPDEKSTGAKPATRRSSHKAPASESDKSGSADISGGQISEEALEALANRIVERIKQMQGSGPHRPARKKNATAKSQSPPPADDDNMVICRCEEITKGAIKDAIKNGMQTLNGIKRITRAGMGLCQGQTCQRLVTQILAEELGLSIAEIEPITARGPVRPLRLAVFANR